MSTAQKEAQSQTNSRLVVLERGAEPFSGLPMIWIGALLPDVPFDSTARVYVLFDGVVKTWMSLRRIDPAVPTMPGSACDLSVVEERGVRHVRVELHASGATEILADRELASIHRRGGVHIALESCTIVQARRSRFTYLTRRFAAKIRSGDVLYPANWKRWSRKMARKFLGTLPPPSLTPTMSENGDLTRTIYEAHCENNDMSGQIEEIYRAESARFAYQPTISILMPVYNVEVRWLRAAIDSIRDQVYDNWELCLADDASTSAELRAYLESLRGDPRIHVVFRPANGHICRATNSAAELATGEYVAFMDNDDALAPDALFHYVRHLQTHPDTDIIYSDEDKIDADNRRYDPQFKPDWSPELFLSYNYVNHFTCMRRSLFERAGRFRPGFEGGQDYDLLLRATELTDRIHHVPRVLYHWRSLPTSTASVAAVKPVMFTSCERGLRDRLKRLDIAAEPYSPAFAERLRLPISLLDFPDDGPSVAIVVPVRAGAPIPKLRHCTQYRNASLVEVALGESESPAAAINRAIAELTDEFVMILDPHISPTEPRWLSRLMGYAQLPGVGCVGPRVINADGQLHHAGILLGMHDETAPERAFAGHIADQISYYFQAEVARNVSALPADCLLMRRSTFVELGGFDATSFPDSLFTVDYCRRLAARGLRIVCHGGVDMVQQVSTTGRDDPVEVWRLQQKHGRSPDRCYNPNLSQRHGFHVVPACPHPPEVASGSRTHVFFAAHNLSATEGAPRYLFDIAAGLKKRGRVEPVVFSPAPGPGADWYHRHNIPLVVKEVPHAHNFLHANWIADEFVLTFEQLCQQLRRHRPDVVVANTLGNFPMIEAAAQCGIPSVWIIHESYTPEQMAALHSPFALHRCRGSFALANRALIASHATARLFAEFDLRHTIEVIHNGLEATAIEDYLARVSRAEAKAILREPPNRKRITAVGTVCERKGQHTLIEAGAELKRRGRDDFLIALVGVRDSNQSYVNFIRTLIERENLHDFVALVPETNDVRPHWRASDIFVCASHVEAFSRSMLEAEAFGLPIVSTPCCGADEQVVWNRNAFRFDFSDARQLANHLERLLASDSLRRRMGEASRAVYQCHFTNEDMLERYERLILNVALHADRRARSETEARKAA
jgi:glycosyltransferase involved in cell wall biosynthesis/GT2 family glycosyltransferase